MSIGRDVYCDTRLMIQKLEKLFPVDPLGAKEPYDKGVQQLLENWTIEGGPFWNVAKLLPPDLEGVTADPLWRKDREELTGVKWDAKMLDANRAEALAHVRHYLDLLENTFLADGREWILGTSKPSLADIHGTSRPFFFPSQFLLCLQIRTDNVK